MAPIAMRVLAAMLLAVPLWFGCGDETSVVVTLSGTAEPGDTYCVAVTAGPAPVFNGTFSTADKAFPQSVTVFPGMTYDRSFSVTSALIRRGREVARRSQQVEFVPGAIGQTSLDLNACSAGRVQGEATL